MQRSILGLILLLSMFLEGVENEDFIFDGYLRGTYHYHDIHQDKVYQDDAIGGKLHLETPSYKGIKFGASLYGTSQLFNDDNNPIIALRGEGDKAYAIVGELYLEGKLNNTLLKIGRQELNTPFADIDDVGMVPNTFEALILVNNDIENLEVFLGQINKMAGVGAEVVDRFTNINGSDNMQLLGLTYTGIKNTTLTSWYNRLKNSEVDSIAYVESSYENSFQDYGYVISLQYAKEHYRVSDAVDVWGGKLDVLLNSMGLTITGAYNSMNGNVANSGFGGGPFFATSEYLIVDHAGKDAKAKSLGLEYDASLLGLEGLTLGLSKLELKTRLNKKSSELDIVANYSLKDNIEVHMAYSELEGVNVGESDAKHLHMYVNYGF